MRPRRFRLRRDSFDTVRRRMIAETELALLIGLRFPERSRRIPTIEAGRGVFHRRVAEQFWSEALGIDLSELATICSHESTDAASSGQSGA